MQVGRFGRTFPSVPTLRRIAFLAAGLVAVAAGLSCSDNASGPKLPVRVLLLPVMPNIPHLSAALGINNFRVIIGTPPNVKKDTVYTFGPGTDSIIVNLVVPNIKSGDALPATIQGRSGSTVLFAGTATVTARDAGSPIPPSSTTIAVQYVGTDKNVASIVMGPRDTAILFGDSIRYRATGLDSLGAPLVVTIPLVISSSDTSVRVKSDVQPNVVRAPSRSGFAWIVASTATGIKDSTRLFFKPIPVVITKVAGDAQSGTVGQQLAVALQVKVQAADSSGVPSVAVTFRSLNGGQVVSATVLTDTNGFASTQGTLGAIAEIGRAHV